jgi:hypothetical protein
VAAKRDKEDLRRSRKVQGALSLGTAGLGLTALGTKGASVGAKRILKFRPYAKRLNEASIALTTTGAGLGGASGIHFYRQMNLENKNLSKADTRKKKLTFKEKAQRTGLQAAGAGAYGGTAALLTGNPKKWVQGPKKVTRTEPGFTGVYSGIKYPPSTYTHTQPGGWAHRSAKKAEERSYRRGPGTPGKRGTPPTMGRYVHGDPGTFHPPTAGTYRTVHEPGTPGTPPKWSEGRQPDTKTTEKLLKIKAMADRGATPEERAAFTAKFNKMNEGFARIIDEGKPGTPPRTRTVYEPGQPWRYEGGTPGHYEGGKSGTPPVAPKRGKRIGPAKLSRRLNFKLLGGANRRAGLAYGAAVGIPALAGVGMGTAIAHEKRTSMKKVSKADERADYWKSEKEARESGRFAPIESDFTPRSRQIALKPVKRQFPTAGGINPENRRQQRMKIEQYGAMGGAGALMGAAAGTSHPRKAVAAIKAAKGKKGAVKLAYRAVPRTRTTAGLAAGAAALGGASAGVGMMRRRQGRPYTDWWDG